MKRRIKNFVSACWRAVPFRVKVILSNVLSTLSGTREMRDFFNQTQGDMERYRTLLQDKSDLEEYRVDKIIRTIGAEVVGLREANATLLRETRELHKKLDAAKREIALINSHIGRGGENSVSVERESVKDA